MKRISRIVATLMIGLVPFVASSATYAAGTCQIGYTGPDSNNMCTSTTSFECKVTNNNNVTITNTNTQEATSGQVTTSGNTSGGNSTSGTVTNSNGSVFNVTITNGSEDNPTTCVATQTVPATNPPVTPVQPPTNGGGATAAATTLPHTSGDSTGTILGMTLAALGLGAVAATGAALLYRRLKA